MGSKNNPANYPLLWFRGGGLPKHTVKVDDLRESEQSLLKVEEGGV